MSGVKRVRTGDPTRVAQKIRKCPACRHCKLVRPRQGDVASYGRRPLAWTASSMPPPSRRLAWCNSTRVSESTSTWSPTVGARRPLPTSSCFEHAAHHPPYLTNSSSAKLSNTSPRIRAWVAQAVTRSSACYPRMMVTISTIFSPTKVEASSGLSAKPISEPLTHRFEWHRSRQAVRQVIATGPRLAEQILKQGRDIMVRPVPGRTPARA